MLPKVIFTQPNQTTKGLLSVLEAAGLIATANTPNCVAVYAPKPTAPIPSKVTAADLEAEIANEQYATIAPRTTVCTLTVKNGFVLIGVNEGPVDPANFDAEQGKKYARQKAIDQLWPLLGFRLRDRQHAAEVAARG